MNEQTFTRVVGQLIAYFEDVKRGYMPDDASLELDILGSINSFVEAEQDATLRYHMRRVVKAAYIASSRAVPSEYDIGMGTPLSDFTLFF